MHNLQKTMAAAAKKAVLPFTALAVLAAPGLALADPPDYSPIIEAVDWGAVSIGIINVMAAGAAIVVTFVGGRMLVKAIKGIG